MPQPVIDAITDHVRLEAEIGGYEAADARAAEIAHGYEHLAQMVGARRGNMAVVANATAGFVQALSSFDFRCRRVVSTRIPCARSCASAVLASWRCHGSRPTPGSCRTSRQ